MSECFAVPYTEKEDELYVAISKEYHTAMYAFHQRNNKKEVIVGWYSTTTNNGEFIIDNSSLIHEFYSGECDSPVHLVVDTTLMGDTIGARGFVSKGMGFGDHMVANTFQEVKVDVELNESEAICLNQFLKGQYNDAEEPAVLSSLPSSADAVRTSVKQLLELLKKAEKYVDGVVAGHISPNREIGIALADALNNCAVPTMNAAQNKEVMEGRVQDLLMVSYLSTLTQAQIVISEKLNSIL